MNNNSQKIDGKILQRINKLVGQANDLYDGVNDLRRDVYKDLNNDEIVWLVRVSDALSECSSLLGDVRQGDLRKGDDGATDPHRADTNTPGSETEFRSSLENWPVVFPTAEEIDGMVEQGKDVLNGYDRNVANMDLAELGKLVFALRRQFIRELKTSKPQTINGHKFNDPDHLKAAADAAGECARSVAHTFVGEGSLPVVK